MAQKQLLVLVDLDGVMADFDGHFLTKWKQTYPEEPFIALEDRKTFYLVDQYETLKEGLKHLQQDNDNSQRSSLCINQKDSSGNFPQ